MFLVPYVTFPRTKDALELYKKAFDLEVVDFHPVQKEMGKEWGLPENYDYENSCMHATIKLNGCIVHACDNFGADKLAVGNVFSVSLNFTAKDEGKEAQAAFDKAVKAGFEAALPFQKMFWGYYGQAKDKYGILWHFNQPL